MTYLIKIRTFQIKLKC